MHASTETLANFSSQLHPHLEGKTIPIGDILELYIPLKFLFSGTIAHNLGEVIEDHHPRYFIFGMGWTFSSTYWNQNGHSYFGFVFIEDFGRPFILVERVCPDGG
jgi:hypothetical protein